jgi:hypothetical protein
MEQSNGPRSPGGIPISTRLIVPDGAAFDPVRRALAAIDAVHRDGNLPLLPISRTRAVTEVGVYEWSDRTGEPLRLRLSGLGEHPELTVIHEIGHFLDHQALGRPGTFASETEAATNVMQAIDLTSAVRQLRSLRNRRQVLVVRRGRRQTVPIRSGLVIYLLQSRELFARAYAQFIVQESHHELLTTQLTQRRASERTAVYHDIWEEDDFEAVRLALRHLFGRRRWMIS